MSLPYPFSQADSIVGAAVQVLQAAWNSIRADFPDDPPQEAERWLKAAFERLHRNPNTVVSEENLRELYAQLRRAS